MNKFVISSLLLTFTGLMAENHDFSLGVNLNTAPFDPCILDVSYINTYELEEKSSVFYGVFGRSLGDKIYQAETNIGFRSPLGPSISLGINYCHEITNISGVFNHAAHPAIEFSFPAFSLTWAHQSPVKKNVKQGTRVYSYSRRSTATLAIPFLEKYELKFSPYYVHKKDILGLELCGSARISDNITASVTPYYESEQCRGVSFGMTFEFGTASLKRNKGVHKSHYFSVFSDVVRAKIKKPKPILFVVKEVPPRDPQPVLVEKPNVESEAVKKNKS